MVTLSATGGPATAALPSPPQQHLQPGPVRQPPGDTPGAALQSQTVSAAVGMHTHSSSAASAVQPPVHLAESQGNAAATEDVSSAAQSELRDGGSQGEQPLHEALAGMSLGGAGSQLYPAHVSASEPIQAGTEQRGQRAEPSFDDPLRRGQHSAAQQGHQGKDQQLQVTVAQGMIDLPLFTGFVSHEQLETAIGSNSYERRLASSRELTHWVKMRGPGVPCSPQIS